MPIDHSSHARPATRLTADTPGIGGLIKQRPEDFIVEEIPAYDPSGEGEHIYLYVQKTNLSTQQLVSLLARHFRVPEYAVGYAGLKDRHAVTRQVISIHTPGKTPEDFPSIKDTRVQVLWTDLHVNKLRRGHLRANRFAIKVRNVPLRAVFDAKRTLDTLAAGGVPNRAGEQRFGHYDNNHLIGRAILQGDDQQALDLMLGPLPPGDTSDISEGPRQAREHYAKGEFGLAALACGKSSINERKALNALAKGATPRQAIDSLHGLARSFYLTSFQSAVFNRLLDQRLADNTFSTLLEGDIAFRHDNGALFKVDAPTLADPETQRRLAAIEVSPSGPLWGPSMMQTAGRPARLDLDALHAFGVTTDNLAEGARRFGPDHQGHRRPLRVPLTYPSVEAGGDEHGHYVRCSFELPPGAFATVVMDEVMKDPAQVSTTA